DMASDAPAAAAARAGAIIARQRTVAVPITDARTTFGALSVTLTDPPDGRTRTTLRAVGDRLGGLFRAVLWRTALMEDGLTPVSVTVRDPQLPLVRAAAAAETTVAVTSIGRADAAQTAYVLTPTDPDAAAAFIGALEADGAVAWVQPVGETDRVLVAVDGASPAARVVDLGGQVVREY
ncbi:MAG: bacterio-opsin activator domain-containing protein, partial [Haloquadratum sp.]|nr:bacterio-opsin activator domain-containing protein [Haloquadratum sp.]